MSEIIVKGERLRPIAKHHGNGWFVSLQWKPTAFTIGAEYVTSNPEGRAICFFLGFCHLFVGWLIDKPST